MQRFLALTIQKKFFSTSFPQLTVEPKHELIQNTIFGFERSINKVDLIGRVGNDPRVVQRPGESNETSEEKPSRLIIFSLATNELNSSKSGKDSKFRTDWHRICVLSPKVQETVVKNVRKGDRVHLSGRLHYDYIRSKIGEPKFVTSIVCDDIVFLSKSDKAVKTENELNEVNSSDN